MTRIDKNIRQFMAPSFMPLVSLVIPVRDEAESIGSLIDTIKHQTRQPDEVVFVDGGSKDETIGLIEGLISTDIKFKFQIIRTDGASPGKGRNIGIQAASNEWIALTDAGVKLDENWLKELVGCVEENPYTDFVYGTVFPVTTTSFEKSAALAYVPRPDGEGVRTSIASCLFRKSVWSAVGGFPDLRAAEDLMFMEAVGRAGFNIGYAPKAIIHWYLRPDLVSTFKKFTLYSKFNVWAEREHLWHYGIIKQYLMLALLVPTIFLSVYIFIGLVGVWLFGRTIKRILANQERSEDYSGFNPLVFFRVMIIILTIDLATFVGWIESFVRPRGNAYIES